MTEMETLKSPSTSEKAAPRRILPERALQNERVESHPLLPLANEFFRELEDERRLTRQSVKHYRLEIRLLLSLWSVPSDQFVVKDHLRKCAAATVSRKLIIWRAFLKTCPEPWSSGLAEIKNPKIRRKQPRFLTDEEVFLLEQACFKSPQMTRDRLFVAFALQLGLRLGEILNLKFGDIEGEWLRIMRKGAKEQRLPLSPSLQTLIKQWCDELFAGGQDWIFPGMMTSLRGQSDPLTSRAAQLVLDKLAKQAGLEKRITPHSLRHTFATKLASQGVNLAALKEILGHERLTTTERYLHVTPQHLQDALGLVKRRPA